MRQPIEKKNADCIKLKKELKDVWTREQKKLSECKTALKATKSKYTLQGQELARVSCFMSYMPSLSGNTLCILMYLFTLLHNLCFCGHTPYLLTRFATKNLLLQYMYVYCFSVVLILTNHVKNIYNNRGMVSSTYLPTYTSLMIMIFCQPLVSSDNS